ncbi:hypothetical protein HK099_001941 [Clydaea vesicula]|uniref:Methylglutaconyl-CoA hydratase n=1 Tax=Clydaea vesicula TaxID=447962 RepID=A0AAD5U6H1_9FUNG|nr:hypothetical protein HK099_001941 [Clydaea vesicula]
MDTDIAKSRLVDNIKGVSVNIPANLILEEIDSGIASLIFDRAERKNAIGKKFLNEFSNALESVRNNKDVRVLIVQSNVPKTFCAGADLKERMEMPQNEVDSFVHLLRTTFNNLSTLPIPTISVIDGVALGGGLEIAMATDFRIAGSSALMGLTEAKLAIIPGAGGTQRLPRIVGVAKAKELIFTGRKLNSVEAKEIDLVSYAVEGSGVQKALELAREILPNGPISIKMAKIAIDKGSELDINSGLSLEQTCYGNIIPTKDRIEGLTAFKEKRTPVYKGE